jgi:glyoxylase I family protein
VTQNQQPDKTSTEDKTEPSAYPLARPLVLAIDHCSLIVADTVKALDFYTGILGLAIDDSRPDLGYPGAWLKVGVNQIHLLEVPNPDSIAGRPQHGGRDHHVALKVSDLALVIKRLEVAKISYSKSKSGRDALFCRDADGNAIELIQSAPA